MYANSIFVVVGILALIAVVVLATLRKIKKSGIITGVIVALAVITLGASFSIIPTGYTGVRSTFGQISEGTLSAGLQFKIPFIQKIETVNNKQQDSKFAEQIWGESSEKTVVYAADVTVTYQIDNSKSAWIFANVSDKSNIVSQNLVNSAVKASLVTLSTEDVTVRSKIEPLAKENVQLSLDEKYGEGTIHVVKVVINDMDFEDSYNQAIANKQIAQMNAKTQEIENQKAIDKATADKQVAITNAEAEAEATLKKAEASAKANELLNNSLTGNILTEEWIKKWDGKMPVVSGSDKSIVNLPESIVTK